MITDIILGVTILVLFLILLLVIYKLNKRIKDLEKKISNINSNIDYENAVINVDSTFAGSVFGESSQFIEYLKSDTSIFDEFKDILKKPEFLEEIVNIFIKTKSDFILDEFYKKFQDDDIFKNLVINALKDKLVNYEKIEVYKTLSSDKIDNFLKDVLCNVLEKHKIEIECLVMEKILKEDKLDELINNFKR